MIRTTRPTSHIQYCARNSGSSLIGGGATTGGAGSGATTTGGLGTSTGAGATTGAGGGATDATFLATTFLAFLALGLGGASVALGCSAATNGVGVTSGTMAGATVFSSTVTIGAGAGVGSGTLSVPQADKVSAVSSSVRGIEILSILVITFSSSAGCDPRPALSSHSYHGTTTIKVQQINRCYLAASAMPCAGYILRQIYF